MSRAPVQGPPDAGAVSHWLASLQQDIVAGLEALDGRPFLRDAWQREPGAAGQLGGGGGLSCVIEEGNVFERGAVLFSRVHGDSLPASASAQRPGLGGRPFEATGVSLVLHPRNPFVPTVHMNVRFFIAHGEGEPTWWFGGGMDLTPCYPFEEDAAGFHAACRQALDPIDPGHYPRFKKWCDDYFFLKHRGEARGVGGVFFDDLREPGFDEAWAITRSVGEAFLPAYSAIVERRRDTPYGERQRDFQAYRRGRYVEFNLVFDRGTLFGLQSGGRTESILCSMPPLARWRYDWQPEPDSAEARLAEFLVPRNWA